MSFLNPALLAFAAAIAVPILIHLFNRRRFQRVSWAAMRFVKTSIERNRRRMQFEDLLLLALRCLVVALFAFALARPALRTVASLGGGGRVAAVIILDHSASLLAGDGARTRFELARQAAESALDALPNGSSVAVLLGSDRLTAPAADPTPDLNGVRKILREARPSELGTDHLAALRAALEILRAQTALRKEIILVTDRQATGWRRLPEMTGALADAARDTRLRVVFVGDPLDDNVAVSALTRPSGFISSKVPLRFDAEIVNRGRTTARQVRATLHVNGGPVIDETVFASLAPGEARRATFFARLTKPGFHSISVRLSPDRQPADDERSVVVRAAEVVRVLVVDGDPAANSGFFLRHALQPVSSDAAEAYFLQPRIMTSAQLVSARLSDFDAVVLADIPPVPAPVVDALDRYVNEGGALVVFPGPQAKPEFYNAELLGRTGLLPASLVRIKGDPATEANASLAWQASGYEHPIFALWNEAGAGSLGDVRFRAAWELKPAPARTNSTGGIEASQVMVRFVDGAPGAVERGVGRGRVMLFASAAGTAWNDLAVRPAFLPVLHRSMASLTEARESRYNVGAGSPVGLRFPAEWVGRDVQIGTPDKPPRRLTRVLRSIPGGSWLEFTDTERAGTYSVTVAGEAVPSMLFAAGLDPLESDLTDLDADARSQLERVSQVVDWSSELDLRSAFDRERVGVEVWLPLTLAVLLLALTETWLGQRFSRPK